MRTGRLTRVSNRTDNFAAGNLLAYSGFKLIQVAVKRLVTESVFYNQAIAIPLFP